VFNYSPVFAVGANKFSGVWKRTVVNSVMSKRRPKVTIYKSAPAPPPPAPAAKPDWFAEILRLVGLAVLAIGVITLAMPWVRQAALRLPDPGVVCWHVERATSAGRERNSRCEPAPGWHAWQSPSAGLVVVPDDAEPVRRRYPVWDGL
jgi:hypothetical protein